MWCGSGPLSALERCLLEAPGRLGDLLDHRAVEELLVLLENISLLLLGLLYGAQESLPPEDGTLNRLNYINEYNMRYMITKQLINKLKQS